MGCTQVSANGSIGPPIDRSPTIESQTLISQYARSVKAVSGMTYSVTGDGVIWFLG